MLAAASLGVRSTHLEDDKDGVRRVNIEVDHLPELSDRVVFRPYTRRMRPYLPKCWCMRVLRLSARIGKGVLWSAWGEGQPT
jgi:hypothetical protein